MAYPKEFKGNLFIKLPLRFLLYGLNISIRDKTLHNLKATEPKGFCRRDTLGP